MLLGKDGAAEYLLPNKEKVNIRIEKHFGGKKLVRMQLKYQGAYGMGEHFHCINYKGTTITHLVKEKFCNQGEDTYFSIPFFLTNVGMGVYIHSEEVFSVSFEEEISFLINDETEVELFLGSPLEILGAFNKEIGQIQPIAKTFLGPWISANHWDSEEKTLAAVREAKENGFPVSVIVLEAWSDEATFYIFRGAKYQEKEDGSPYRYEDFDFSESENWNDPKGMIESLKKEGVATVLWQIPVYKEIPEDEPRNKQNEIDAKWALKKNLCVKNADGSAYRIPEGNWFAGSMIPDFSNPSTREDWFSKRQYLLDIGVAGFKTDGGEFIYTKDCQFSDGKTGAQKRNTYCQDYVNAYYEFVGSDRILFSRAGSTGASQTPAMWAGDHQSTNEEFKHVFYAAMSAACSGVIYWSFDIGGFAGELPSLDVYRRATMFAVFTPIMQWHSEPDGGQFKEIMPGAEGNNERSPWNLAVHYHEEGFVEEMRYWHNLRMELVPYIEKQCQICAQRGIPLMRPLFFEEQEKAGLYEDEYFFGDDFLVAPLLEENQVKRMVYLPKGKWEGFFSKEEYEGGKVVSSEKEKFPVFVRK